MSTWQPKKLDVTDVNGGNRYDEGMISVEDYNKTLEGIMQANLDSEIAVANSEQAKLNAIEAVETSSQASIVANNAKQVSDQASLTANNAMSLSENANDLSIDAKERADSAQSISTLALQIVKSITATSEENGGAIGVEIITLSDGNLQILLKNTKGEKGDPGECGKLYQELGQNTDAPISQVVVTNELTKKLEADDVLPLVSSKADKSYVDVELGKKANTSSIPTKVSELVNDSGYDTAISVDQKIADSGGAIISTTAPTGKSNAIWINPSTGVIKYWSGTAWASTYGVFA